jgi:S-methylmethionine-dependent homocysteine/selenocysteine methylase
LQLLGTPLHRLYLLAASFRLRWSTQICNTALAATAVGCGDDGLTTVCVRASSSPADDYDANGIITPQAYAVHAQTWEAAGAEFIGGCCGVGPPHMAAVAAAVSV